MRETYYRSANLHVFGVQGFATDRVVVTFGSYDPKPGLDRPGFGEAFLRKYRIDAVHVVPRSNAWYQYDDIDAALAAVNAETRDYACRVTYGSSMGAYAAISFAERLGAQRVIAISPQYSIDPRKMPEDRRWRHEAERIRFIDDEIAGSPGGTRQVYAIYDNRHELDRRHIAKIAETMPLTEVALPFAGHPAAGALAETGLLSLIVRDMIAGEFDAGAFVTEFERRAPGSAAVLAARAAALPADRLKEKLQLVRRAVELQPENSVFRHQLADLLSRSGAHDQAIAILRDLIDSQGGMPDLQFALALACERAGRRAAALAANATALAHAPDSPTLLRLQGRLLFADRQFAAAERCLRRAVELDPDEPEGLYRLSRTLARLGRRVESLPLAARAVEHASDRADYHAHLGRLYLAAADSAKGEAAFAQALDLAPRRPDLVLWLTLTRLRGLKPPWRSARSGRLP